jgi:hypothetical protein
VVGREIGVTLNPGNPSVPDIYQYPATTVAAPTITLENLFSNGFAHTASVLSVIWELLSID